MSDPIVIVAAKRTAMGGYGGAFKTTSAADLGAAAIKGCFEQAAVDMNQVDETLLGCVLQAGQGQAPARQAALGAGLPYATGCTTLNKMCGSGLKAVMMGHDAIVAGSDDIVVAGGMECMSMAPYLLPNHRFGKRMGHDTVYDHMFLDGLEDAYDRGCLMGTFADQCAAKYDISRQNQDDWAIRSSQLAKQASDDGFFNNEITPTTVKQGRTEATITIDEGPQNAKLDKIPKLKPAFGKNGTVTAANASSISDGAAAVILMRQSQAQQLGLPILATIAGHSQHAQEPCWFTTAPTGAIQSLLDKLDWQANDVDLYEINEAFAVVTLVTQQQLQIDPDKINVSGGACALGHPIGASGARILVTLIYALKRLGLQRGIASLCIGGGEAVAMAITVD